MMLLDGSGVTKDSVRGRQVLASTVKSTMTGSTPALYILSSPSNTNIPNSLLLFKAGRTRRPAGGPTVHFKSRLLPRKVGLSSEKCRVVIYVRVMDEGFSYVRAF